MNIFSRIEAWADNRNLIEGGNPRDQFIKLIEETGELAHAMTRNNLDEISDAIGDCIVVLTILARQHNLFIENAIEYAYNVIKDRKGKMIDGIFVKEDDFK